MFTKCAWFDVTCYLVSILSQPEDQTRDTGFINCIYHFIFENNMDKKEDILWLNIIYCHIREMGTQVDINCILVIFSVSSEDRSQSFVSCVSTDWTLSSSCNSFEEVLVKSKFKRVDGKLV